MIVMLCPAITDQMEFDRRVCAAGLTDYIRATMPEDRGAGCTPVDPETGRPDPSREAFEHDPGPYVRVRQVAPGFRIKRGWRVAILTEPRKPA